MLSLVLAISLCSQNFAGRSKHDPPMFQDRRSPAQIEKMKVLKQRRHIAAEVGRREFDEAITILRTPPLLSCPCTRPGVNAFQ